MHLTVRCSGYTRGLLGPCYIWKHAPSQFQSVTAHWWVEFGHSGRIYTKEIGKHYKTGLPFSEDWVIDIYHHTAGSVSMYKTGDWCLAPPHCSAVLIESGWPWHWVVLFALTPQARQVHGQS